MTIDEDAQYYMDWWMRGVKAAERHDDDPPMTPDRKARASYAAGRAAYLDAERIERERLEWCPNCDGEGAIWYGPARRDKPMSEVCQTCHGTGRRA